MLLCHIDDVAPGDRVSAPVLHPSRASTVLLAAGTAVDARILVRLKALGIEHLWTQHDATAELESVISPQLQASRRKLMDGMKGHFQQMAACTVTDVHVRSYRDGVMDLICELVSNKGLAGLTDRLIHAERDTLFTHAANVSYLALLAGLELETYIVQERRRLPAADARDVTTLGIGALLHDIGKTQLDGDLSRRHEIHRPETLPMDYYYHTLAGYDLLGTTRTPASAKQVVLCHHQRFDGKGWPEMDKVTGGRQTGVQEDRQIHIHARITAAANVLENLLRSAEGQRRPPAAALSDFAGERFDGWFDPAVRQAMLRKIPPYPTASHVRLSDGAHAAVVAPSLEMPCRPVVRLLEESKRMPDGTFPNIDLLARADIEIVECMGVDVRPWRYHLDTRSAA